MRVISAILLAYCTSLLPPLCFCINCPLERVELVLSHPPPPPHPHPSPSITVGHSSSLWRWALVPHPPDQGVLETNKNKFRFEPKQTETRSVSRLFRFVSVCFVKPKKIISVCFGFSNVYRNNRNKQNCNKPKQTKTTQHFMKNTQIYFL